MRRIVENEALKGKILSFMNTLPVEIALLDKKGKITDVNNNWEIFAALNGIEGSKYYKGENYITLCKNYKGDLDFDGKKIASGIKDVITSKTDKFVFEYTPDSILSKRWYQIVVSPILENNTRGAIVMHSEIFNLRLHEEEKLKNILTIQKKVNKAMLVGQEKEKNYLGQELHDNINQLLVAAKLHLELSGIKNEDIERLADYPIKLINKSISEIRKLSQKLVSPPSNIDLKELIVELLSIIKKTIKIETSFEYTVSDNLISADLRLNIYRIMQELTNNILKYAHATKVRIAISEKDAVISILIMDDGKGFNIGSKRSGIGLYNIKKRVDTFNGKMEIISSKGNGCQTVIHIPLIHKHAPVISN